MQMSLDWYSFQNISWFVFLHSHKFHSLLFYLAHNKLKWQDIDIIFKKNEKDQCWSFLIGGLFTWINKDDKIHMTEIGLHAPKNDNKEH